MKVFGKWIIVCNVEGKKHMVSHCRTKKDATNTLNGLLEFKNGHGEWMDSRGRIYSIERNTTEYPVY